MLHQFFCEGYSVFNDKATNYESLQSMAEYFDRVGTTYSGHVAELLRKTASFLIELESVSDYREEYGKFPKKTASNFKKQGKLLKDFFHAHKQDKESCNAVKYCEDSIRERMRSLPIIKEYYEKHKEELKLFVAEKGNESSFANQAK